MADWNDGLTIGYRVDGNMQMFFLFSSHVLQDSISVEMPQYEKFKEFRFE